MDALSGNISSMIFKQVVAGGMGDVTLDSSLLNVFMELDGQRLYEFNVVQWDGP